ncbi:MAG: hypothetical protein HYU36_12490 [Planctomycetes bacterium]|nr:hypothetical protein [Planctomycetota bacterium]
MNRRTGFLALFLMARLLDHGGDAWAQNCSMCKTSLAVSEEGRSLTATVRLAVLVLQLPTLILLGAIGYLVFSAARLRDGGASDPTEADPSTSPPHEGAGGRNPLTPPQYSGE